jgi:hypothetical protein
MVFKNRIDFDCFIELDNHGAICYLLDLCSRTDPGG